VTILDEIKEEVKGKQTVSIQYLWHALARVNPTALRNLKPSMLKVGDILRVDNSGSVQHPGIIFKIKDNNVYCLVASNSEVHSIREITNSRFLNGYYTYTIVRYDKDMVLDKWVGTFDNMKELRATLKEVKQFYNKIL
jgi:hypothetical protein